MSEVYHPDGRPTGPPRRFPGWDFETAPTSTGWQWHACDGSTIAATGTTRTRPAARLAAFLFAATASRHRPAHEPAHLQVTFRSGARLLTHIDGCPVRPGLPLPRPTIVRLRLSPAPDRKALLL